MQNKFIFITLVLVILCELIECQLGQFGAPFFNNLQQIAQSSFNPNRQQQYTFGGDFVFPQNNFNNWGPPPPPPRPNNRPNRPQQQPKPTLPPPPPPTPPSVKPPTNVVIPNRIGGRISQTKCEEYSKLIRKTFQIASLSLDSNAQDLQLNQCDYMSTGLIVGGEDATQGEFPHMAAIGYADLNDDLSFKCGGTLISDRFVLTAAHCESADRVKPTIVRLAEHDIAHHDRGSPEIDVTIESFIPHESYNRETRENDIAVIKMTRSVPLSKIIRPACLPQPDVPLNSGKAVATGWGYTEVGGLTSEVLQKVQLSIIPNDKCRNVYNDISNYQVFPSQLCAGELVGGKDTCGGDSGGPLQITMKNQCLFQVIGITSYGSQYCGKKNSPGIYTRVSSYVDWIEKKVWG